MTRQSQFVGFGVQVELKDGKLIQGKIGKATSKGLTLYDVKFSDGGTSQAFKVRSSRLKDLKVLSVAENTHGNNKHSRIHNSADNSNQNNKNANNKDNNHHRNNSNMSIISGNKRQKSPHYTNNNDDWQNDDVEKIKDQADFDFQGNLGMFNKKDIFAQLKQQDEVEPSKRLVSHNKKGNNTANSTNDQVSSQSSNIAGNNTSNNVNYEIDEMVIPNAKDDSWNTISHKDEGKIYEDFDDSDDDDEEFEDANYFPITKSINITHLLHSAVNSSNEDLSSKKADNTDANGELLSKLEQMIIDQTSKTARSNSLSNFNPTLINPKNKKQIPMATPVQLLEMERLTEETFHISMDDCIDNNFALNASYYIRQKLGGDSRLTVDNSNPEPLVIVLASDSNRSGRKALTLARYLCQTQQVRVLMVFTCSMREIEENNKSLKANIDIFVKCGGKVVNDTKQLKSVLSVLNSPIELIIDAMQGFDCNLVDFDSNQNKIIDMINWCNDTIEQNNVKICSIDMPSGYDSGSGSQNFDVAMHRVDYILCSYSWPLISLVNMKSVISHNNNANNGNIILIDCGIPKNVYSERNSLRKFFSVDTFSTSGYISLSL